MGAFWACPVCGSPILLNEVSVRCDNNHAFDRAKQGYFNLLLANQKNSQDPGDSREMMLARRSFLNKGFYQPLLDQLSHWVDEYSNTLNLLDSGCGEGYYLNALNHIAEQKGIESFNGYGVDISKEAIKLSARAFPNNQWVVASAFNLPVQNDAADVVLRIFSPAADSECKRVLKPEGRLWRISPGPNHLIELKEELYGKAEIHSLPKQTEGFKLIESLSTSSSAVLKDQAAIQELLTMTPFFWQSPNSRREQLMNQSSLEVTFDFVLEKFGYE